MSALDVGTPVGSLEVRLLGSVEVIRDGQVLELGGPQQRAVVGWLALADGRVVAAERLLERLWGDDAPHSALGTLQSYISRLRRVLEPARPPGEPPRVLVSEAPGYALRVERDRIDVFRFEDAVRRGRDLLAVGRPADALSAFDEALGHWRGDPLAGVGGEARDAVVVRLQEERAVAVEDRIDALLRMGEHASTIGALHEAVADEPLRERRWAQLALALYRSHRQSDALRVLSNARATLVEHVGVDPGPELQQLESQILAQDPALSWTDRPAAAVAASTGHVEAASPQDVEARDRRVTQGTTAPTTVAAPTGPVGRDREWARLTSAISTGGLGQPIVVLLEGEAGIGKTTLLDVLAATAAGAGWQVSWGRCVDEGLAPALWPWVELVRAMLGSGTAASPDATPADRALAEFAEPGASTERTRSLVEIATDVVAHIVDAPAPQLLIVDDLHWADAASLDLLSLVAQRLVAGRVVLAVAHRPLEPGSSPHLADALSTLARLPVVERLPLRGLTRAAVAALLADVSGEETDDAEVDAVLERTAGNPLFVAELARTPRSARGTAGLSGLATTPHVPAAVRDVVRTRLRHLTPATTELLVLAGLLGREIDLKVLARASGRDLDACLDDIDPAVVSRVLVPSDGGHYTFGHALVRDALLHDMSPLRRARLHLRVAAAIESLHGSDRDHAEPIAMHRWASLAVGDPLEASAALIRASDFASARGALERGIELAELALDAAQHAPTGEQRLGREVDAMVSLLKIETLRSFMGSGLDDIADRIDLVADRHDSDAARMLALFTRWSNINQGRFAAVDALAEAARDLAEHSRVPFVRLFGLHTWGTHCWLRGRITESAATFRVLLDEDQALRATAPDTNFPPVNHGGNAVASFALVGDDAALARALDASTRRLAPTVRHTPSSRVDMVFTPAVAAAICGDAEQVRDITAGLARGEIEIEHPHFSPACRIMHGWAMVLTSSTADAADAGLGLIDAALAEIEATPIEVVMSLLRSLRAHALLHVGRAQEAAELLRSIAARSDELGELFWLPETLRLLALAERALGGDGAAILARARATAVEQGSHRLVERIDAT